MPTNRVVNGKTFQDKLIVRKIMYGQIVLHSYNDKMKNLLVIGNVNSKKKVFLKGILKENLVCLRSRGCETCKLDDKW